MMVHLMRSFLGVIAAALLGVSFSLMAPAGALAQHNSITDALCGDTSSRYYNTCNGDWCAEYPSRSAWQDAQGRRDYARAGCGGGSYETDEAGNWVEEENDCYDPCGGQVVVVVQPRTLNWKEKLAAEGKNWWEWPHCAQNPEYKYSAEQRGWDGCSPTGYGGGSSIAENYGDGGSPWKDEEDCGCDGGGDDGGFGDGSEPPSPPLE